VAYLLPNYHTHLRRYRQIAGVLTHHGLGALLNAWGLERFVPLPNRRLDHAHRGKHCQPAFPRRIHHGCPVRHLACLEHSALQTLVRRPLRAFEKPWKTPGEVLPFWGR
jgi:hypothetical protein